jgi:hypothetical protein
VSLIGDFLIELKKRRVYRVAVAYGIVAWVVVQAASIVVPELLLPSWITRAVIVVALLGFPIALVLAWAFDITPHGVQRTANGDVAAPVSSPLVRARLLAPRALLLAFVGVVVAGAAGAVALAALRGARVPTGAALIGALDSLVAQRRYATAFDLARRAAEQG